MKNADKNRFKITLFDDGTEITVFRHEHWWFNILFVESGAPMSRLVGRWYDDDVDSDCYYDDAAQNLIDNYHGQLLLEIN